MIIILITLYLIWIILGISYAYKWYYVPYYAKFRQDVRWGVLFRLESNWIGVHHSKYHGRTCINLLPCITIWVGNKPTTI